MPVVTVSHNILTHIGRIQLIAMTEAMRQLTNTLDNEQALLPALRRLLAQRHHLLHAHILQTTDFLYSFLHSNILFMHIKPSTALRPPVWQFLLLPY